MQPTSFLARRSAIAIALASLATAMPSFPPATVAVRRHVALVLSIDAATYRDRLDQGVACGPRCAELQRTMVDPIRAVLARKFAFADWTPSPSAPNDTVQIRWVEMPPPLTPGAWVEFRLLGAGRARPDSLRVIFEQFASMIDRTDWDVSHVRDQWLRRLTTIFDGADMVPQLFGRIPINVPVRFLPGRMGVSLPISGTDIGAATDPRPAFRIVARVDDPGPPSSSDVGEVGLTGCVGIANYVCDITSLRYIGGKAVTDTALTRLIARATLTTMTVHLQSYTAGPPALVAPGGGR